MSEPYVSGTLRGWRLPAVLGKLLGKTLAEVDAEKAAAAAEEEALAEDPPAEP